MAAGYYVTTFFDNYFLVPFVWSRYTGNMYNCSTNNAGVTTCDFSVTSHCTPETTPPTPYNPTEIRDSTPPADYWLSRTVCVRVPTTAPWECNPFGGIAHKEFGIGNVAPGQCTKR